MRIVVANWKMNHLHADLAAFAETFLTGYVPAAGVEVGVAPVFTLLSRASKLFSKNGVQVLAQNAHFEDKGAFTGEISMAQARDVGCVGVILGHSERRQHFGETDQLVNKKARVALATGLSIIVCVGETQERRSAGEAESVVGQQVEARLA